MSDDVLKTNNHVLSVQVTTKHILEQTKYSFTHLTNNIHKYKYV